MTDYIKYNCKAKTPQEIDKIFTKKREYRIIAIHTIDDKVWYSLQVRYVYWFFKSKWKGVRYSTILPTYQEAMDAMKEKPSHLGTIKILTKVHRLKDDGNCKNLNPDINSIFN